MPCRATQERQVMVETSDKMWSTGERNGKPLQHSCIENPMKSIKRQDHMTQTDELPTMTRLSWVALHGMAYSFIELGCGPCGLLWWLRG